VSGTRGPEFARTSIGDSNFGNLQFVAIHASTDGDLKVVFYFVSLRNFRAFSLPSSSNLMNCFVFGQDRRSRYYCMKASAYSSCYAWRETPAAAPCAQKQETFNQMALDGNIGGKAAGAQCNRQNDGKPDYKSLLEFNRHEI